MTRKQLDMFVKMLSSNLIATTGDYTFKIEKQFNNMYELNQYYKGRKTKLYAGSIQACKDAAIECISMMYPVTE